MSEKEIFKIKLFFLENYENKVQAANYAELEKNDSKMTQCASTRNELLSDIEDKIEKLKSEDEKITLRLKYIMLMSWKEIRCILKYSRSSVYTFKVKAINNLHMTEKELIYWENEMNRNER